MPIVLRRIEDAFALQSRPDGRKVLVTLHPSALLRMAPELQHAAFEAFVSDLKAATLREHMDVADE